MINYFDHFAKSPITPVGRRIVQRTQKRVFSLLQPVLRTKGVAILEIGPGHGELAHLFRHTGYHHYTAVEPNTIMREALQQQGFAVKDYVIPYIAEDDTSYDVLVVVNVFEHLEGTKEAQIFANEAYRVLRPDGILCIVSPDYLHWQDDFFICDHTHSNITSLRRTLLLFQNSRFRRVTSAYLSGFVTGMQATLLSNLMRVIFLPLQRDQTESKLYKLKLSFLRCFFVVGAKEA